MISSEVQRTLVKSPPELWAELSDPASLARHLGELGEIRITRIEPERTVEWEAENTSGTVQIKPSGWGTKVTLSVTREISAEEAAATPVDAEQPAEHTDPGPPAEADASTATEGEPEPSETPAAQATQPEPEPQPQAAIHAVQAWPADARQLFAPQTPAAAASRPLPPAAPEPEPEPDEPQEQPEEPAPGRFDWLAYEAHEPEPRRGFFARLFGRRRGPAPTDDPSDALDSTKPAPGPSDELPPEEPPQAAEAEELVDSPEPSVGLDAPEADAGERPQSSPAVAQSSPADPSSGQAAGQPQADAPTSEEASGSATEEEPADISSELRAAEELATAEVTAVLTSVLDRLGAAHHRPFSRA